MRSARFPACGAGIVMVLVLTGCSGGGSAAETAAEANVAKAQKALTEAQAQATAAQSQFCTSSATYITALDRYGDVLNQTATTVGDVKTAGRDLERPQGDALTAGTAAIEAQRAVDQAEQELADAQAQLDRVISTPTATTSPSPAPSASGSTPAVSSAATRVQQAEQEFTSAVGGITDSTPLATASQQFNAAVVSLEFAWLQLFNDAGCLTGDQQKQAATAVHDYTAALQKELTTAGYYTGEIDGVYGPSTVAAIEALQKAHGLPVTGTVDAATDAALQADVLAKGGASAQATLASTAAVQQTLALAGFWDGPVDGTWTPALTDALKKFQEALGVPATGTVDAATLAALEKALAGAQSPTPAPTVTVTVTVTATVTATPSSSASG